jgi:protein-tyrosine phosphatase
VAWPSERSRDGGIDEIPLPEGAGRLFLCGKHAIGPDPDSLLERVGASTIVCLTERHEIDERYPALVSWLDEHESTRALHRPIPDFHAPDIATFTALVDEIVDRLRAGEAIVMHCGGGIGRTGTVAAGVLVAMGTELDDALAQVRTARPMAGPEAGTQAEVLRTYAESRH